MGELAKVSLPSPPVAGALNPRHNRQSQFRPGGPPSDSVGDFVDGDSDGSDVFVQVVGVNSFDEFAASVYLTNPHALFSFVGQRFGVGALGGEEGQVTGVGAEVLAVFADIALKYPGLCNSHRASQRTGPRSPLGAKPENDSDPPPF